MKTLVKVLLLFITTGVFAQKPIEKTIGDFTELKVYDLIEVELIKSHENKITISGKNKSNVVVNNKNGTLKIKMKLEDAYDGNDTKVILQYTNIDIIDVNEGANVHSKDTIKQFEIDLKAQEGGKIMVNVDVEYINIKSVIGGNIIATGHAKRQNVSILTGGIYDGKTLASEVTEVSIIAAGTTNINASKLVNAKVRAGGNITIYGNPERVEESKALGGKITVIKD